MACIANISRETVSSLFLSKLCFDGMQRKQLSWDCLIHFLEQSVGSEGMQRKQLSWDCLIHFLEQSVGSERMQRKQFSWDLRETVLPLTQSKVLVLMVCNANRLSKPPAKYFFWWYAAQTALVRKILVLMICNANSSRVTVLTLIKILILMLCNANSSRETL